ncbi:hypothetical protein ACFV1F_43565 [Streptomyces sp. NPDC059590]|uniref:hypothetical protein n=1 Tax=Streptomyces sp. NPDC059590 TaxID=3346877 RepID=UPI00368FDCC1
MALGRLFPPLVRRGVVVTHCGASATGLRESAAQVERALARFAGPAWTRRP